MLEVKHRLITYRNGRPFLKNIEDFSIQINLLADISG